MHALYNLQGHYHYFLSSYALYSSDLNTGAKCCAFFAFPFTCIDFFSSFRSSWKTLNVTVYVHTGIRAFVGSGMHHYCTFVAVVSRPGVSGSLICYFSMRFFQLHRFESGSLVLLLI